VREHYYAYMDVMGSVTRAIDRFEPKHKVQKVQ
jgi:hypothetical protein